MASTKASRMRDSARRMSLLTFENASSMGLRSGPQALAHPRPAVQRRERGVRARLVDEHEALDRELSRGLEPPGTPQELVAFRRTRAPFFWENPSLRRSLLTVDTDSATPLAARTKAAHSRTAA
jgi:hypothetical protein